MVNARLFEKVIHPSKCIWQFFKNTELSKRISDHAHNYNKKHFKATKILSSARIWKLKKKASDKHKNEQWCLTNKTFWNFSMNGVIHNILYAFNTVTFSFRTFGDWIINTVTVNIDLLYFKTGIPAHIILSSKGNIGSNYSFRVLRLKDINTDLNFIQSC